MAVGTEQSVIVEVVLQTRTTAVSQTPLLAGVAGSAGLGVAGRGAVEAGVVALDAKLKGSVGEIVFRT